MKNIKVYGSGCRNCVTTAERLSQVAQELAQEVKIDKVTDLEAIMTAGVLSTPGIEIDGVVKHTGSVPSIELVRELLK
ncbi:thioredoxin family protein [Vibrio ezurae]|uniref:Thioredoxin-like fold domain-containing protein n=1 Tax=Vibrio ezurae NBRC 102218 TaxID=1219080 RepID=U3B2E6_9VIBR|nr:thioredoxin family protein [Vibrio ezurae]GAD80130.1 hypothetical protein VEZ01S_25_00130 [Vibrio ezurae NBRC 102218]